MASPGGKVHPAAAAAGAERETVRIRRRRRRRRRQPLAATGGVERRGRGLNVLSLFDGIGGAYFALRAAGAPVARYQRSEIDTAANRIFGAGGVPIEDDGNAAQPSPA